MKKLNKKKKSAPRDQRDGTTKEVRPAKPSMGFEKRNLRAQKLYRKNGGLRLQVRNGDAPRWNKPGKKGTDHRLAPGGGGEEKERGTA